MTPFIFRSPYPLLLSYALTPMMRRAISNGLPLVSPRVASPAAAAAACAVFVGSQRGLVFRPRNRDYQFLMEEVFDMYAHYKKLGCGEAAQPDTVNAILDECSKLCSSTLFPLYQSADEEGGCKLHADGRVTTPKGFKEAWNQIVAGGWTSLTYPEKYGGQGLPTSVGVVTKEMMATANWALLMYPGLTAGAATTLQAHGTEVQRETFLKPLVSGQWSGTMCLTEPHCGTDLAQVKTKAEPVGDGTFKITGMKIFISSGDHDLAENIVHIVLARLPGAPEGVKGISLFIVPKYSLKPDGTLDTTKRNVTCAGLEKKMGIKANATGQMAFDNSIGYQIGKDHEGLKYMFTFMNTARIGTAVQGVAHSELAFQNGLAYIRERVAMRALSGTKSPTKPADEIIHHASVKHLVLFAKVIAEGGRALVMDMARLQDKIDAATDEKTKKHIDEELGMLTPIAKGFLTEMGQEAASACQQAWGGHGYIVGNGMEQIVRDARISTIYEGTTQVQAMDLIGRKVLLSKRNELAHLQGRMMAEARKHMFQGGVLGRSSRSLASAILRWKLSLLFIKINAARNRDNICACSVDFLMYSGFVTLGYYWLRMANVAQKKVDAKQDPDGFYQAKVDMCNFYYQRVLPRCSSHLELTSVDASSIARVKNDTLDL